MTAADTLTGGFTDPPVEAARAFRAILDAMARPGRIVVLAGAAAPAPASPALAAALLTLADTTTPVHLAGGHDTPGLRDWLRFHTGAPLTDRAEAAFAVGTWDALLPLDGYAPGTAEYPDRSATLMVELPWLAAEGVRLTGPGIQTVAHLSLPDIAAFRDNAARFPLGLDFVFTCGDRLAALPRTTRVEAA
jgi:alpha-D-ribose 1-methylphosphonate 5-triphosphate synthase subunit PhnH